MLVYRDVEIPREAIGVLPAGVTVEHAVQVDAHQRAIRVIEIDLACLRRHWYHFSARRPFRDAGGRWELRARGNELMTSIDHRKAAEESLQGLVKSVEAGPRSEQVDAFLQECAALAVAIHAFHMEGIRFRMFNVDRQINKGAVTLTEGAQAAFADVRRHLEAAGFHTRSHQAPT